MNQEARALRLSVYISLAVGAIGVIWGIITDSRIVLFDGIYTVFGTALSGLSLFASWAAGRRASAKFPFGLEAVIPVAIVIQGAALAGTLTYAALDSVALIRSGGTDAAPATVIGYGLLTLGISLVIHALLPRIAPDSELAQAEAEQWKAGAVLSGIISIGAAAALGLSAFGLTAAVPYADPILVLVATAAMAPVPWRLLRAGGRELIEAAPEPALQAKIEEAATAVAAEFGLGEPIIRATKLGRRLYAEIDFIVTPGGWDVSEEDKVRRSLIDSLHPLGYQIWANVELTTDPSLTR